MTNTRRDFFRLAAVPLAWRAFDAKLQAAAASRLPDAGNEGYWQMVKRQYPLEDGLLYLNAANVCPASRLVMDRHLEYLRDFHSNPSFQNRDKYVTMRESLRDKLGRMLRVSPDEVAITRNTSEGSNLIVKGVDLKPGDEVLITDHNHPSNNDSWRVRARRDGFIVKSLPVAIPAPSVEKLVADFERAITPRTRVIAITHVTSTTGIRYPAREIAALARKRNIFVHLDGAQTFGALDVNLSEIGCDSYSASAHKWLMGPLENGILWVRGERIPEIWPSIVTAGWAENLKGARKFEVFGQRDDPRVVALEAAVDFSNLIGMPAVEARMQALATRAKLQLKEIAAVELKTNLEPELSGGVVKFRLKKVSTKQAYDTLWEKHRLAIAMTPSGDAEGLRFSPQIYNSMEEVDRAVAAVKEIAG
ncbi:MAG TPA: aminotransferase class V-fold PLP-dependent enzyme [Bryobacteraceae bacterium]|nr:aminotransferase class V-fold PLP-dependent enzyme [Bryobacteraceae bacterium]